MDGNRAPSRVNCFDALRLLAALAVLVSHSFSLAGDRQPHLGTLELGVVGVFVFFGISGFLIAQSWSIDPHVGRFLAKRALRLWPALLVVLLVSTLVIGPAVSTLPLADYLSRAETWSYLGNNAVFATAHELPGVFARHPTPREVNASIHTLQPEVWAYLGIAILGLAGGLRRAWVAPVVAVVLWIAPHQHVAPWPDEIFMLQAFAVGTALYVLRARVPWNPVLAAGGLGAWLLAPPSLELGLVVVVVPYAAIYLAYHGPAALRRLTARGDFSYGIYVFAWPIGQVLVALWPSVSTPAVIAITLPVTVAVGAASWRFVERPALAYKKRLVKRTAEPRTPGAAPERPITDTTSSAPARPERRLVAPGVPDRR
jgi:peptidoglycan/LPS O-acetylase OafA/YrhL